MASKVFHSSGSVDIDRVRHEIASSPSSADNYRRRSLLLYMWLSALQQQGADTRPFTDVDKRYYLLEDQIVAGADERLLSEMAALIDEGFGVMEDMQSRLIEQGRSPRRARAMLLTARRVADVSGRYPSYGI